MSDRSDFAVALSGSVRIFFVGCKCVFDSEMRRFQRAFGKIFMKKSCKNIWWERKKCIPLHSLSGSKRASEDGRQAGSDAEGCCEAADARREPTLTETPERKRCKKNEEKFGGYRFSSYLCKVFPPHENRRSTGHGKRGREIPEDIERLTIDKDKKVQELIK